MEVPDWSSIVENAFDPSKPSFFDMVSCTLTNADTSDSDIFQILNLIQCQHLPKIKEGHKPMVDTLLKTKWYYRNKDVVDIYSKLISNVLVSNLWAVKDGLKSIVALFTIPKSECVSTLDVSEILVRRQKHDKLFVNVHVCLQSLFKQIPGCRHHLSPILEKSLPYRKQPTYLQECFILNLLKICDSQPELRFEILQIIVQHLIGLDVHASRVDIMDADFDGSESVASRIQSPETIPGGSQDQGQSIV
jgi:hypothetical protein